MADTGYHLYASPLPFWTREASPKTRHRSARWRTPMTLDDLRAAWPGVVFEPGEHGWVFAHANRDRCSFAGNMPSELDQHIREIRDALTMGQRTAEKERADVVAYLDAEGARMRATADTYVDEEARSRVKLRASEIENQASRIRARAHVGASEEP